MKSWSVTLLRVVITLIFITDEGLSLETQQDGKWRCAQQTLFQRLPLYECHNFVECRIRGYKIFYMEIISCPEDNVFDEVVQDCVPPHKVNPFSKCFSRNAAPHPEATTTTTHLPPIHQPDPITFKNATTKKPDSAEYSDSVENTGAAAAIPKVMVTTKPFDSSEYSDSVEDTQPIAQVTIKPPDSSEYSDSLENTEDDQKPLQVTANTTKKPDSSEYYDSEETTTDLNVHMAGRGFGRLNRKPSFEAVSNNTTPISVSEYVLSTPPPLQRVNIVRSNARVNSGIAVARSGTDQGGFAIADSQVDEYGAAISSAESHGGLNPGDNTAMATSITGRGGRSWANVGTDNVDVDDSESDEGFSREEEIL